MLVQLGFLMARYVHVVCTTLLVGGTLFYEMVVPVAIDDLREEAQLAVFAKARWVFRWIVWVSAILLIVSGIFTTQRHWQEYTGKDSAALATFEVQPGMAPEFDRPAAQRPGWWWVAHASVGFVAVLISLFLTAGHTPPSKPIAWMRFNLVLLLIVIFLASATRHMRLLGDDFPKSGDSAFTSLQ
jgi:peptidoglycan/LPS O-acetylase OafA/YrhL